MTRRARHHRHLLQQLTPRWKHEYPTSLRENSKKIIDKEPCVKVGDLVVLKNNGTARCPWKIAKVTKLIESKDGKIRAAEIQVLCSNEKRGTIILRRPLHLLIPIEISAKEFEKKERKQSSSAKPGLNPKAVEFQHGKVRREAAVTGELKRRIIQYT